jgi:isoleucyl-tRNA synthetase
MLQSPVVVAENLKYQPSKIEEKGEVASMFHQIKNMVLYFTESKDLYLSKFKKETFQTLNIEDVKNSKYRSYLDTWILQELDYYLNRVHKAYTTFNLRSLGQITIDLIISLSKNYIKFNKLRFKSDDEEEVKYMLSILWNALDYLILGMSPMTPFTSEAIYQKIRLYDNQLNTSEYNSIHWRHIPKSIGMENGKEDWIKIVKRFLKAIDIVRIIRTEQLRIETRKPLQKIFLGLESLEMIDGFKKLEKYFLNELNILNIEFFVLDESYLELKTNVNRKIYGPMLGKKMKELEKFLSNLDMFEIVKNKSNITFENISIPFTDLEISYNPHSKLGKTKETKWLNDYSYQFNEGLLIVIDTKTTPEIELIYQGRTLSRQIQDMRKTLNLKSSNIIKIYVLKDTNIPEFILKQDKYLVPYLGQSINIVSVIPKNSTYLGRMTCFDIIFYLYTN